MFTPVDLEIFSGILKGIGRYQTASNYAEASEYEAKQYKANANKAMAVAQKDAAEELRLNKIVQSRILAVAAASGAGASDPTVVRLIGKQAGEGAYRAALAIYRGEDMAAQQKAMAKAKQYEADMARSRGYTAAASALIGGATSLYQKYGAGGPGNTDSSIEPAQEWWGDATWKD